MHLGKPQDVFRVPPGDTVTKRNLYDLIQHSKVEDSPYWGGAGFSIGNTPQQGINWIGSLPGLHAVIIKTRPGSYEHDGWQDSDRYRYSFKARRGDIVYTEKANSVLLDQREYGYPVMLFTEAGDSWIFQGRFTVSEIEDTFVVLERYPDLPSTMPASLEDLTFVEGDRRYVTHLVAERSREVVSFLKSGRAPVCDICKMDFLATYGVDFVEAHHKVPLSTFEAGHVVRPEDLVLLCPNCHRAVHAYMKIEDRPYAGIKAAIRSHMHEN